MKKIYFYGLPAYDAPIQEWSQGIPAIVALADCGLVGSRGDARKLIEQGGAYIHREDGEGTFTKRERIVQGKTLTFNDFRILWHDEPVVVLSIGRRVVFLLIDYDGAPDADE